MLKKEDLLEVLDEINVDEKIQLNDIPEIDLYMDQVIQLFESKLSPLKRNAEDKVLTKTMINNYAKAKLLMSVKNKKYTKEHLILMSLIYDFKGTISINDIKLVLDNIVNKFESNEEYDLRRLYDVYLELCKEDSAEFKKSFTKRLDKLGTEENRDYEEKLLLIASMISMSNMYRRMGELLIDKFFGKEDK